MRYSLPTSLKLTFSALSLFALAATTAPANTPTSATQLEDQLEILVINDASYTIPFPWKGNRVTPPKFKPGVFRQIPVGHTKDGTKLYVTDETHRALNALFNAAKEDGITLLVESGYRSERYQKKIFTRMIGEGRTFEDIIRYVAPPGYSQHAMGTAIDFSPSNWRFARLPEYDWLKANASLYGFKETYPEQNELHYPWEAWHWNYSEHN